MRKIVNLFILCLLVSNIITPLGGDKNDEGNGAGEMHQINTNSAKNFGKPTNNDNYTIPDENTDVIQNLHDNPPHYAKNFGKPQTEIQKSKIKQIKNKLISFTKENLHNDPSFVQSDGNNLRI